MIPSISWVLLWLSLYREKINLPLHIIDNALHDWDKWNVKQISFLFYVLFCLSSLLVSYVCQLSLFCCPPSTKLFPSLDRLILQLAMLFHMSSAEMHARQIQIWKACFDSVRGALDLPLEGKASVMGLGDLLRIYRPFLSLGILPWTHKQEWSIVGVYGSPGRCSVVSMVNLSVSNINYLLERVMYCIGSSASRFVSIPWEIFFSLFLKNFFIAILSDEWVS